VTLTTSACSLRDGLPDRLLGADLEWETSGRSLHPDFRELETVDGFEGLSARFVDEATGASGWVHVIKVPGRSFSAEDPEGLPGHSDSVRWKVETVGGKAVIARSIGALDYTYPHGDLIFAITTNSPEAAADFMTQLP
jgi:hypothetical protein